VNEGLGSAATLAVKQRGGIQSVRKGEVPGHAAAKPRAPSKLAVRGPSPVWLRGARRKARADEEAPLDGRCAGSQRGGLFTEPSPTDLGVMRGRGPLGERSSKPANAGGATGAPEARPMANERRKKTPPRSSDEIDRKPSGTPKRVWRRETLGSSIVRLREATPSSGRRTRDRTSRAWETRSRRKRTRHGCSRLKKSMAEADRTHHARGAMGRRKAIQGEAR
jgi:hypothetical protein